MFLANLPLNIIIWSIKVEKCYFCFSVALRILSLDIVIYIIAIFTKIEITTEISILVLWCWQLWLFSQNSTATTQDLLSCSIIMAQLTLLAASITTTDQPYTPLARVKEVVSLCVLTSTRSKHNYCHTEPQNFELWLKLNVTYMYF